MLYLSQDFYSNFNSGVESGDNELLSDMIVNELSELIVYNNSDLVSLLNKVGIKAKEKISDEKLVDIILDNLSTTPKLVKGLAFLISANNDSSDTVKIVKGADGNQRRVSKNTRAAKVSEIDMVASGIVGIADSFTYKPQLKKEFKISLMNIIKTKSKAVGDRDRKHDEDKNGKYILLGLLVIGLSVGAYFYLKNRKKIAAEGAVAGGDIPPIIEPTIIEPVIVPPVVAPLVIEPAVQTVPIQEVAPVPQVIPEVAPIVNASVSAV